MKKSVSGVAALALFALLMAVGQSFAQISTVDFSALTPLCHVETNASCHPQGKALGSETYIDPATGVKATGYYLPLGEPWTPNGLWLRNTIFSDARDRGLGICNAAETDCIFSGESNELSNYVRPELIVLSRPEGIAWKQVWVSSLDPNTGAGERPERGQLWALSALPQNESPGDLGGTLLLQFEGRDGEGFSQGPAAPLIFQETHGYSINIPPQFADAPFLAFEAFDWTAGAGQSSTNPNTNNDYLVWKAVVEKPCIELEKQVSPNGQNWFDANEADCSDAPRTTDAAHYQLIITNNCSESLADLVINDSVLGLADVPVDGTLAAGQSITLTEYSIGFGNLFKPALCPLPPAGENTVQGGLRSITKVKAVGAVSGTVFFDEDPACLKCGPCAVSVTMECSVLPARSTEPFECSRIKPIEELLMVWNGTKEISSLDVYSSYKPGSPLGANICKTIDGPIKPGAEVTIDCVNTSFESQWLSKNDVAVVIHFADDTKGISLFHKSCSDEKMNGPEDCGNPEGNAKTTSATSGGLTVYNDWVFDGMFDSNGNGFDCSPTPPAPSSNCRIPAPPPPPNCLQRLEALQLQYTGLGCGAVHTSQASDKVKCTDETGFAAGAEPVHILVTSKNGKKVYGDASAVYVNDLIGAAAANAGAAAFAADTVARIYNASEALIETIQFRTSCSQPLNLGDQFGSLKVISMDTKKGGPVSLGGQVQYTYKITNTAGAPLEITARDDKFGPMSVDPNPLTDAATATGTHTEFILQDTTNTITVNDNDNPSCTATASSTVTVEPPPPPAKQCKGGVAAFTVQYNGAPVASITFTAYSNSSVTRTYSNVNTGDILTSPGENGFTLNATAHGQSKLGATTKVLINETLTEIFHTSCSCNKNNFIPDLPACLDASSPDNATHVKGVGSPLFDVIDATYAGR